MAHDQARADAVRFVVVGSLLALALAVALVGCFAEPHELDAGDDGSTSSSSSSSSSTGVPEVTEAAFGTSGTSDPSSSGESSGPGSSTSGQNETGSSTSSSCIAAHDGPCVVDDECCDGACSHFADVEGIEGSACTPMCELVDECPPPSTGDAVPVCLMQRCALLCSNGETCPDGATCIGAYCAWED